MSDTILSLNAASGQSATIGATRAGQQVQKAVINRLINSLPQPGQGQAATPSRSVDRVQISSEAYQRLAAEQS